MVAIASGQAVPQSAQSKDYALVGAASAPRPVVVRRFSPSSIVAVSISFIAFVGLTAGAAYVFGQIITKVTGVFAGL